jgi:hypothetical protein
MRQRKASLSSTVLVSIRLSSLELPMLVFPRMFLDDFKLRYALYLLHKLGMSVKEQRMRVSPLIDS